MAPRRSSRIRQKAASHTGKAGQDTQSSSLTPDDTVVPSNTSGMAGQDTQSSSLKPDDTVAPSDTSQQDELPPIGNVHQAFKDMLSKNKSALESVAAKNGFNLRVATICSGTEAPIFALKLIKEISRMLLTGDESFIEFDHLFSVENEPFKQAYISRNAPGSIVFRDVVDLADQQATAAPTILGEHCDIPKAIDLLIAGTSCVDFSQLNTQKQNSVKLMSTGTALFTEWKAAHQAPTTKRKTVVPSLRHDFFDDVHDWIENITPSQIQAADCGESSFTFLSTVCYINHHRPKMVILENVQMAPWDAICGLFLHSINYAATHVNVDTKDYYIPQTRTRGYVVAVDRQVFGDDTAEKIITEWKPHLAKMKRPSSTPMQQWLLSPHDPLTIRARQDESEKAIASSLKPSRETDWGRSKKRHSRVRRMLKLGKGRPVTAWGLGGHEKPYDRLDRLFIKSQRTRALDCTDIYFLQCLYGRFYSASMDPSKYQGLDPEASDKPQVRWDYRFKSQAFDLSQNVDRGSISPNFRIVGCLTPRGMNLITNEGRQMSGYEALNLQGLPLRDLDLTRESQEELRDLAGNAMSTTVVGAALLALFISVDNRYSKDEPSPLKRIDTVHQSVPLYEPLYRPSSMPPEEPWVNTRGSFCFVRKVLDKAKYCRRYCYCNGSAKYSTDDLVQCAVCGFTRCTSCAGNPKHHFGSSWSMKDPIMNDIAPQEIMKYFPTAITCIIGDEIVHIPSRPYLESLELQRQLLDALRSATFYYTRTLISENLTICYSAKDENCTFDLQAVISDQEITWYLYLDPWSACGQLLCNKLEMPASRICRPFGRVRIHPSAEECIPEQNAWEFWVFDEVNLDFELKYHDNSIEVARVTPLANLPPPIREDIQSIVGIYDHHPECDTAENSLHVSRQHPKRYLFKDPSKTGIPEEDFYILSNECKLLDRHEFRDFCVKFLPTWHHEVKDSHPKVFMDGYWQGAVPHSTSGKQNLVSYKEHAGSRSIPNGSEMQMNTERHKVRTLASASIHCNILDEAYMTLSKYAEVGSEKWALVSRSDYSSLFDLLAPVNVKLRGMELEVDKTFTEHCGKCCPPRPRIYWMEKAIVEISKPNSSAREPYSVSRDIHLYQIELRKVGQPLQVAVNIKDMAGEAGYKIVTANYEVDVDLLRHRAVYHLPRSNASNEAFSVQTTVSVKVGSLNIGNLKFVSFKDSLHRLPETTNANRRDVFVDGLKLSENQAASLNWMLEKETGSSVFTEREIEECRFDPLNLRVLAVAERDVSRPGGILADDVGYGKTVISLALMKAQEDFDQRRLVDEQQKNAGDTSPLAASLVLAPRHLVDQWAAEAAKFLDWKNPDVLVIKSSTKLQDILKKTTSSGTAPSHQAKRPKTEKESISIYDELHAAKLIIVSTAVFDDKYYTSLGKYAGSFAQPRAIPKSGSTKHTSDPNVLGAFQDWYEDATMYARRHLSGFDPTVFNEDRLGVIEERHKSLQESWKDVVTDFYDKSTRLGCQTSQNESTGEIGNGEETDATVTKEYNEKARAYTLTKADFVTDEFVHVLEAFSFSRVIYDEFSYQNFCVAQFVKNARAHAKWVLSATPPTSNVKSVCDIGQLLGIHVARPVKQRPGLPLITEGPALLRLNSTEQQLSYGKLFTDESVRERVEAARRFLSHFASANPFDEKGMGKIEVHEQIICSNMTRFEFARYHDLQRDLRNADLDFGKLLEHENLDSETVSDFPEEGGARAGIALAWIASVDCADTEGSDALRVRSSQTRSLEKVQARLKLITNVAIWLVLRRFEELEKATPKAKEKAKEKANESVTQYIEEFSCYIEAILNSDADDFDGVDGLEAVSHCLDAAEKCSQWLVNYNEKKTSDGFYKDLFTRLGDQILDGVCMSYFQLSADDVAHLEDSEVLTLIRELDGGGYTSRSPAEAKEHLEKLVAQRKTSTLPQGSTSPGDGDDGVSWDNRPFYPPFHARKRIRGGNYTRVESELSDIMMVLDGIKEVVIATAKRVTTAMNLFSSSDERKCNACGEQNSDLRFLPDCGHLICSEHLEVGVCGRIKSTKYPTGSGCPSIIRHSSIPIQQIDRCPLNPPSAGKGKGPQASPKSRMIADKISKIIQSANDKILLFYQFEEQRNQIDRLLRYDPQVGDWEEDNRVRMLKLNSEEAAGSNFQDANHVMFTNTPIFGKQEDYDKYVKQAKGRAIRHGQKKSVHVYYFVTANTFEVDLLQLRTRRSIKLGEGGVAYLVDENQPKNTDGDAEMGEEEAGC